MTVHILIDFFNLSFNKVNIFLFNDCEYCKHGLFAVVIRDLIFLAIIYQAFYIFL